MHRKCDLFTRIFGNRLIRMLQVVPVELETLGRRIGKRSYCSDVCVEFFTRWQFARPRCACLNFWRIVLDSISQNGQDLWPAEDSIGFFLGFWTQAKSLVVYVASYGRLGCLLGVLWFTIQ